jgi:hypothetical protein
VAWLAGAAFDSRVIFCSLLADVASLCVPRPILWLYKTESMQLVGCSGQWHMFLDTFRTGFSNRETVAVVVCLPSCALWQCKMESIQATIAKLQPLMGGFRNTEPTCLRDRSLQVILLYNSNALFCSITLALCRI